MNVYGFLRSSKYCGQHVRPCPACGKETFHTFERRREWLTLFFLPIVPLSRGQGITRCNLCGHQTTEGGKQSGLPGVDEGTKTCPDCAELIKLEARVCRYCGRGFSSEELVAAREFAEATAAHIADQRRRQAWLRRARLYRVLAWLLILPGGLWSMLIGCVLAASVAKEGLLRAHLLPGVAAWLIMSLPFFFGLVLRGRSRRFRRRAEGPSDAMQDSPNETSPPEDLWGSPNLWESRANIR